MASVPPIGYSTNVVMHLLVNGKQLPVARTARGTLMLREVQETNPVGFATLVISIDGVENIHEIVLCPSTGEPTKQLSFF